MNNKSESQNKNIFRGRIKQTSQQKNEIIFQGGYTFYNQNYKIFFFSVGFHPIASFGVKRQAEPEPNQYKDQFDLMLK